MFFVFLFSCFFAPEKINGQCRNRCLIAVNGKYGYIDTLGRIIIKPQYDYGTQFSENLAFTKKEIVEARQTQFIDTMGKVVIDLGGLWAEQFVNGVSVVSNSTKEKGLINKNGEFILPIKYNLVSQAREGIVAVKQDAKWAFFNIEQRKFITGFLYDEAREFNNGLAAVAIDYLYGFINTEGKTAVELKYSNIALTGFNNGLAGARNKETGKWGYIDTSGHPVIDFRFSNANEFKENKAFVTEHLFDTTGYFINRKGQKLFGKQFTRAYPFKDGLAVVRLNTKEGVIDSLGNWIVNPIYDYIKIFYYHGWIGFYNLKKGKPAYGILNDKGKIIMESRRYSDVVKNNGDCILPEVYVGNNHDKLGYVSRKGHLIWKPTE